MLFFRFKKIYNAPCGYSMIPSLQTHANNVMIYVSSLCTNDKRKDCKNLEILKSS